MNDTATAVAAHVEQTEDRFFAALRSGDARLTEDHLDARFLIVDVNSGSVSDRAGLVAALRDGVLAFDRLDLVERTTRVFGDAAIVVGRTTMAGSFAGEPFAVASRYTHVFVRRDGDDWRLATGQGTPIADTA
jgi:ketosteroid isomerase-like protein